MTFNIRHSYVDFTGKPYIYYNGVNHSRRYASFNEPRPYRSIVRANNPNEELFYVINRRFN